MNHVLNERGEPIIATGQERSPARMATVYCETIDLLIAELDKNEPLMVKVCRANNVPADDMYSLIKAARYYKENNIEPLK